MTIEFKPLVIVESPFSSDEGNIAYAFRCVADSYYRGESPIASHLLYTQFLDDKDPVQRQLGIEAGLAWYRVADKCVVYLDRGVSSGMSTGIVRAIAHGVPVEERYLGDGK